MAIIDDEAFLDTALEELWLPRSLVKIGGNALVTYGAHHGENPSLRHLTVEEGNEHFEVAGTMLLERKATGAARLLLCLGGCESVHIPAEVDEIAPYAFNGVSGLEEVGLSDRIASVGMRGLGFDGLVSRIVIDLMTPIEGRSRLTLDFPHTDRSAQQQMLALSVPDHVDVRVIFEHYDNAVINASSFDVLHAGRLALYDQAKHLMGRLKDPVYLTEVTAACANAFCARTWGIFA